MAVDLVGVLVCKETGQLFGSVMKEVFSKLGMTGSYFRYPPDDKFAVPYRVLDDEPSIPNGSPCL